MACEWYLSKNQLNKRQMCSALVCTCRYRPLVSIDWRIGWKSITFPAPFLVLWLHYKCSTFSFNSYAEAAFVPECPEIPESERIDCAPGQVVSEVRKVGSLLLVFWVLFKRNEYMKYMKQDRGGGGGDGGPLICLESFLPCLIKINSNTVEAGEAGEGKWKARRRN